MSYSRDFPKPLGGHSSNTFEDLGAHGREDKGDKVCKSLFCKACIRFGARCKEQVVEDQTRGVGVF